MKRKSTVLVCQPTDCALNYFEIRSQLMLPDPAYSRLNLFSPEIGCQRNWIYFAAFSQFLNRSSVAKQNFTNFIQQLWQIPLFVIVFRWMALFGLSQRNSAWRIRTLKCSRLHNHTVGWWYELHILHIKLTNRGQTIDNSDMLTSEVETII